MIENFRSPTASRKGRPPSEETGLIDELVLREATALFLSDGYGRTTLDLVAKNVGIGKSALYRRYPGKEELFSAVVKASIVEMFSHMEVPPSSASQEQRLQLVGEQLIRGMLHPRCVAFMRITAAEAANFPMLAKMAYEVSFEDSAKYVAKALEKEAIGEGVEATDVARRFVEVAVHPLSFQAAFGIDPSILESKAENNVQDAIKLLKIIGFLTI